MIRLSKSLFALMCVLSGISSAHADAPVVIWPEGWEVEAVAPDDTKPEVSRQRAVKTDQGGTPVMVMELTVTQVESGHQVNLQGVLLEMRKSVQKAFSRRLSKCLQQNSRDYPESLIGAGNYLHDHSERKACALANIGRCGGCR